MLDVVRDQLRRTRATSSTASGSPTGSSSAPRPSRATSTSSGDSSRSNPHVIGDFTWTGWDYLGEAGIGRVDYPDEDYVPTGISAPYPWLTGWVRRHRHHRPPPAPVLLPRDRLRAPARALHRGPPARSSTAARRPGRRGRGRDTVSSWSWDVPAGSPATVDVYSDADEVELLLNGRSIGRAAVGAEKAFLARFDVDLRARRAGRRRLRRGRGAGAHRAADRRRPAAARRDRRPRRHPRRRHRSRVRHHHRSRTRRATSPATATGSCPSNVGGAGVLCRPRIGKPAYRGAFRRLAVHDLRRARTRHRASHGTGRHRDPRQRRRLRTCYGHGDRHRGLIPPVLTVRGGVAAGVAENVNAPADRVSRAGCRIDG